MGKILELMENGTFEDFSAYVRYNLEKVNIKINGKTPLFYAIKKGLMPYVKELLDAKANLRDIDDEKGRNAFTAAAEKGDKEMLELLSEYEHIDLPDKNGNSALMVAAREGHKDIVEWIINLPDSFIERSNASLETAKELADKNGHNKIKRILEQKEKKLELLEAVYNEDNMSVLDSILKGADINTKDNDENTILNIAVSKNLTYLSGLLLYLGANPNIWNKYEKTPLHFAVMNGNLELVRKLIVAKADVNAKDIYSNTPLSIAVQKGNVDIILLLMENGAKVTYRTVHEAKANGQKLILKALRSKFWMKILKLKNML